MQRKSTKTLSGSNANIASMHRTQVFPLLVLLLAIVITGIACGTESADTTFSKVASDDTVRNLDDFSQAGIKKVKEYDVTGLPKAISAYQIYFTPPESDPIQFEVRIYPDYAAAVAVGEEYAAEVTGIDANLREVDVRWKDGTRDRRSFGASRVKLTALYGDYAIHGNVILLCEGRSSEQSLERCAALFAAAGIGADD